MQQEAIAIGLDIAGRVQGVGYRASMQAQARALQLAGWVRNQPDGHVAALVQGPRASVESLIAWCHGGPPAASVDSVQQRPCPIDAGLSQFSCLPTGW